jgi:hypothetical protein
MAIQAVIKGNDLQGMSTEVKPSAENGTIFHEIDTGRIYVAHEGDWLPDKRLARAVRDSALI